MNGFEQQQYASVRRPLSWKMFVIISGTVILIILIILGARWLIRTKSEAGQRAAAIEQAVKELDRSLSACDNEQNPDKCRAGLVEETARRLGAAEICNKLEGNELTGCAWKVAREQLDPDACGLIEDSEKQADCLDSVFRSLASEEKDISWCEKISSDLARTRCVNAMSEEIAKTQGCAGTGIDQSVCDQYNALTAAVASEDPAACLALSESDQIDCLDIVGSGDKDHDDLSGSLESRLGTSDESADSDNDGLSDAEEYNEYGTNPAAADSDGDGYSDGTEIQGGYNPLGSGKLN